MATPSSELAGKVAWTEPGGLQSTGLQSQTQLCVCVCAHTHTHTHTHTQRRTLSPKPTFIYLEVTVCDGMVREFKVVLLGDLGLLTLSTRGDCPLCQTPKANTVCAQRANQGKAETGVPRSQCRILMRGSHFIRGFWLHQPEWPGRKADRDSASSSEQSWPRPPTPNLVVTPQRSLPCGFCLWCHSGGISSKP